MGLFPRGWFARRPQPIRRGPRLWVEQLEDRSLLSASLIAGKPVPVPQFQWDMVKIGAPSAWSETDNGPKVVIADIDTGIDYTHPDLYLNVWLNQGELPASLLGTPDLHDTNGLVDTDGDNLITFRDLNMPVNAPFVTNTNSTGYIDAGDLLNDPRWEDQTDGDNNTYVDDLVGWNFVTGTNDPMDDNGHGTHTAGTLGAVHNNAGNGVDGVYGNTQIMALKAFDQDGGGATYQLALDRATAAIYYSGKNGARASNNSWGVYGFGETKDGPTHVHQKLYDAIVATPNVLFVASAGNNGINNDTSSSASFPASYSLPNIISVAATASNDSKPVWSNYGANTVDLGAPGANVLSTVPGGYAVYSGTSMAAPHVTGTAALILSQKPGLTVAQVKDTILDSVDSTRSMANTVSGGRLNVARALSNAQSIVTSSTTAPVESAAGETSSSTPAGNKGGRRVIQRIFDTTSSADAEVTTTLIDLRLAGSSSQMLASVPLFVTTGFSLREGLIRNDGSEGNLRIDGLVAPRYFDETDIEWGTRRPAAPNAPMNNQQDMVMVEGSFFVLNTERGTATSLVEIASSVAVSSEAVSENGEVAIPTAVPASVAANEPTLAGSSDGLLKMATSKFFWLAAAALGLVHAALRVKLKAHDDGKRQRRVAGKQIGTNAI